MITLISPENFREVVELEFGRQKIMDTYEIVQLPKGCPGRDETGQLFITKWRIEESDGSAILVLTKEGHRISQNPYTAHCFLSRGG